jgi:cell fate regulator YaaT (PSP1 superfamily)
MAIYTEDITNTVAGVRFYEIGKVYHFGCAQFPDLRVGDFVIVGTTRGRQMGQVMSLFTRDDEAGSRDYKPILRRATPTDMMQQKLWQARETEALINCREKAYELGGYDSAKFVAAQYNFDGSLLTFLFSAEDKINTSRLRGQLQRSFKAKVEVRQIGPRDVAKLIGGMGACGIPRCCSTFLTDFSPISIKMAKAQGISLNPSEITGMCGRLRCCLIYEYEQYVEARKQLPKRNKRVGTVHGEGKVIDVHPLQDAVTVLVEGSRHVIQRDDIIPMEEWEAFQAKAEAGCSKHDDGPCECGQRGGQAEDSATSESSAPEASAKQDDAESEQKPRRGRGRGRGRRGRSRRRGRSGQSRNRRNKKDNDKS